VVWFGAFTAFVGSFLLALNTPYSGWVFVAFLFSNAAWLLHGLKTQTWSLVMMQIGFSVTSVFGTFRWLS
jgi:hypothetical protein